VGLNSLEGAFSFLQFSCVHTCARIWHPKQETYSIYLDRETWAIYVHHRQSAMVSRAFKRRAARAATDRAAGGPPAALLALRLRYAVCCGARRAPDTNNVQLPPWHLAAPARGPAAARAGRGCGARVCRRAPPLHQAVPAESRSMSGMTCALDGHAARTSASATPSSCTVCALLLCAGRFSASCALPSLLVGE
jgi:hypothetical protein